MLLKRAKLAGMQEPSWGLLQLATLGVSWILLRSKAPLEQLSRQMVMPLMMASEQWAGSLWVERAVGLEGANFIFCNSPGHFQKVGSINIHPYNDLDHHCLWGAMVHQKSSWGLTAKCQHSKGDSALVNHHSHNFYWIRKLWKTQFTITSPIEQSMNPGARVPELSSWLYHLLVAMWP